MLGLKLIHISQRGRLCFYSKVNQSSVVKLLGHYGLNAICYKLVLVPPYGGIDQGKQAIFWKCMKYTHHRNFYEKGNLN